MAETGGLKQKINKNIDLTVGLKYLHFVVDTVIHEVAVAHRVYGGDNNILYFGVFVPQVDPFDGIVPVNPTTFSFNLNKTPRCK